MSDQTRIAIVLGMHRSGTSAVAGFLESLGLDVPPDLLPAHAADNPGGYFEPRAMVQLNNRILKSLGLNWRAIGPISPGGLQTAATEFAIEIREVLTVALGDSSQIVLKDPRLCRLLPVWLPVIREFDSNAVLIHVIRDANAVSDSLARRANDPALAPAAIVDGAVATALWLRYLLDAGANIDAARHPVRRIVYEDFAANADAQEELTRWLQQHGFTVGEGTRLSAPRSVAKADNSNWLRFLEAVRSNAIDVASVSAIADDPIPAVHQPATVPEEIAAPLLVKQVSGQVSIVPRTRLDYLFVTQNPNTRGQIYRVKNPVDALNRLGKRADWCSLQHVSNTDLTHIDRLVLHRCEWDSNVEQLVARARRASTAVLADIDDLVFDPALIDAGEVDFIARLPLDDQADWRRRFSRYRQTMDAADQVLVPTEALMQSAAGLGLNALLKPNGISPETWAASQHWKSALDRDDVKRIGYASGTPTHQGDFVVVTEALQQFLEAHDDWMLTIIGSLNVDDLVHRFGPDRVERRPIVSHVNLAYELARLDVNLAPLEYDKQFCAAKSPLKWFEAAACGVPTIASDTGAFADWIVSGSDGYLASNPEQWLNMMELAAFGQPGAIAMSAEARVHSELMEDVLVDRYLLSD